MLDRVEAFEHGELRIAPRTPETRDERPVTHAPIMAKGGCERRPACVPALAWASLGFSEAVRLEGIHHISAITGDAPGNVEFYTGVLGMRMVKRTVNQDEPSVYHLFYGDEEGSPGMDLTFFEYPGVAPGVAGAGMVHRIVWRVASRESLEFWREHLAGRGVEATMSGDSVLFADPEGLEHELVDGRERRRAAARAEPRDPRRARAARLRRGAGLQQRPDPQRAAALRDARLHPPGGRELDGAGRAARRATTPTTARPRSSAAARAAGRCTTWRSPRRSDELEKWRELIVKAGARPTPVVERFYFKSVYFLEPSGVLFEIATIGPGFAIDEDPEHLGERLSLPAPFEPLREQLEGTLRPLPYPPAWRA